MSRAFLALAGGVALTLVGSIRVLVAGVTFSPATLQEVARVEAEIDRIEAETLKRLEGLPDNPVQRIELLGNCCSSTKSFP